MVREVGIGRVALLVGFALLPQLALAQDEVTLKDGSVLRGTIKGMDGGVLKIENAAAGTGALMVKLSEVQSLRSDADHTFQLKDGSLLIGKPSMTDGQKILVQTAASGSVPFSPGDVVAVNPPAKKAITHTGNIGVTARVTDGNTRTKSASGIADYEARTESSRLTIHGDVNYAETEGEVSARTNQASIKYDYFINRRWFCYVNAGAYGDEFASLNLRTTLGAGTGYQFFDPGLDGGVIGFYEEIGISYFDEDLEPVAGQPDPDDNYAAGRVAGKFDWAVVKDRLAFFHRHEVFFGFEDEDDVYVDTQQGIRATLVGNFYATAQVNFKWDNTPASGAQRSDTEYLFGLGWGFNY
ncbi:MAG: DUF481 domain-containing protein [Planctomycetota bacterium]